MTSRGGHLLFWIVLVTGAAADLVSKSLAFRFLRALPDRHHDVWPGVLALTAQRNTGGPFSILPGRPMLLVTVTIIALAVILYLYASAVPRRHWLMVAALALVAGGALGNLTDRLVSGSVRDFLNLYAVRFGTWHYPIFNLADILITVGAILLFLATVSDRAPVKTTEG